MRKKKIYLDTSVISYLRQEDSPKEMQDTQEFWEILKKDEYDVYISEVVVNELSQCAEPKRTELLTLLSEIQYNDIAVENNLEIIVLADEIKKLNIVPPKSENDRRHIAAAVFSECDINITVLSNAADIIVWLSSYSLIGSSALSESSLSFS